MSLGDRGCNRQIPPPSASLRVRNDNKNNWRTTNKKQRANDQLRARVGYPILSRMGQGLICWGRLGCAGAPDVEEGGGDGEEDGAEDDADGAEDGDASEDGEQDGGGVGAQVRADQDGVEDVVDGANDDASPDGEECGLSPMAVEAEVDGDWSPDEEGTEGGDHREGHEGEGPEDDAGDSEDPEGEAGEEALNGSDCQATEGGGQDGVADAFYEFVGLVFAEGQESAQACEGDGAVAKEEEEQEEHDDELGDDADGVAEE